ncbi:MAG: hypothetical protein Q9176_003575 [Flavoplaca citrina]
MHVSVYWVSILSLGLQRATTSLAILGGPEPTPKEYDLAALRPRAYALNKVPSLRLSTQVNHIATYTYPIPNRPTTLDLYFDTSKTLDYNTLYPLISQSIQAVTLKLQFGGDRPVPGQNYTHDVLGHQMHHLHIGIWSVDDERKPDELTYIFVQDTLKGLWEYMVRRKVSLNCEARLWHKTIGMVAIGWVQDIDAPELEASASIPPES